MELVSVYEYLCSVLWHQWLAEATEVIQATEDSLLQTYIFLLQKSILQAEAKDLWVTKTWWVCKLNKHMFVIEVIVQSGLVFGPNFERPRQRPVHLQFRTLKDWTRPLQTGLHQFFAVLDWSFVRGHFPQSTSPARLTRLDDTIPIYIPPHKWNLCVVQT